MGLSGKFTAREQAKQFGDTWERLPQPRPQLSLEIVDRAGRDRAFYNLGPHPPRLWPEDLNLLHELWLEMSKDNPGVRHRDVVHVALTRLKKELIPNP